MAFIQIIDYRTDRPDDVDQVLTDWINATTGIRTARRTRVCRDRHDPTHYMEIIEFDSVEDAAINSNLPQTQATHEAFVPLCTDGPRFIDLDVLRDEQL
ncbi:hypothetical protein GCM10022225_26450 [Plantactinospora mayteni]|uniref:ABM domain-containing protein n=1 Tax=Plantactinospora mayteni TaxID=566021 RepID=A0ABQ4EJ31_9ACTN|nr:hypothetical protein [Plantactinospora mayteni]GIG94625.1 hypothetical protein Pma05_11980 [Plantactinospora mayteni]